MRTTLIVAGGTGGHIIPAIAFGQWAITSGKTQRIEYVCGNRPLEKTIYSHFGISPHILPIEGSPLGTREMGIALKRSQDMIKAWLQSKKLLRKEDFSGAFLFGGYISLPFLFSCREKKIPMLLHEQNATSGKVTRLASKLGVPIAAGWTSCEPLNKKTFQTIGTPTRRFEHLQPESAWNKLGVGRDFPSGPKVLVLGGSLGSSKLTDCILSLAKETVFRPWTFLLLGSAKQPHWITNNVCNIPPEWDLSPHFSVTDVAISRGGGSTLSELENLGIPALVIPWRQASGDHQQSNANLFLKNGLGDTCGEEESHPVLVTKLCSLLQKSRTILRRDKTESCILAESINIKLWQLVFESK